MYHPVHNSYSIGYWRWWTHWFNLRNYWMEVKYFWQRGTRGWADCDLWSFDSYICEVSTPALQHLKENKYGVPGDFCTLEDPSDEEFQEFRINWHNTIDQMTQGFEAAQKLITEDDQEVRGFFGPGPLPGEDLATYLNRPHDIDWEGYKAWRKKKQETFDEGMRLFHKHFFSLWD